MSIEVTPLLFATAVGWIVSSVTAAWTLSRRSKIWDEVEDVIYVVFGDRKMGVKGLQQKYLDLLDDVEEDHGKLRGLLRALDANAADEQSVEDAVRIKLRTLLLGQGVQGPTNGSSNGQSK